MALSSKINDKEMALLDKFEMGEVKTKENGRHSGYIFQSCLGQQPFEKTLVVLPKSDRKFYCQRETSGCENNFSGQFDIYDLLAYKYLIIPKDAIGIIEKTYKM